MSFGRSLWPFSRRKPLTASRDRGGGPAQNHLAATPPFDVPLYMASAADQTFDRIGGGERLPQAIRQPEGDHGEGLIEPFANAGGGTWIAILKASRQILQQAARGCALRLLVGAGDE